MTKGPGDEFAALSIAASLNFTLYNLQPFAHRLYALHTYDKKWKLQVSPLSFVTLVALIGLS